ncbi:TatD DNase family protein [Streptomyces sp. DfronAA-171]|nr:TatD DNase family protein [Streptomyces sp. DfronAA-171]
MKAKDDKTAPPPLPEPLRVAVADAHTHLDMQAGTVEEALAKAASVGVTRLVQVGCDLAGSRWAARTAGAYDDILATVALHPNEAPRIVHGDPDGWSRQGGAAGGRRGGARRGARRDRPARGASAGGRGRRDGPGLFPYGS